MALIRRGWRLVAIFVEAMPLALIGLVLGLVFLQLQPATIDPRGGLAVLVDGTAERPFVYRQLAPLLVRFSAQALGLPLAASAAGLSLASGVAWVYALRALAGALFPRYPAFLATVLSAGPLPLLYTWGGYVYDLPHLALFTLGLALLARGRYGAYLLLFPVLVLSKETALLLVPVYALSARAALPGRQWGVGLGLQLLAFAVVRGGLALHFAGNAGADFEQHWFEHAAFLWAYPRFNAAVLGVLGAVLLLVRWRWPLQPVFLQAAAVIVPMAFAGYWLVGYPGEARAWAEAYPPLALLTFHALQTLGRPAPAVAAWR